MPIPGNKFAIDNDKVKTVYRLIASNPEISAVKIMERTHFSQSTVNRILKQLKDDGLIEYTGSKKTGGYRVVGSQTKKNTTEPLQKEEKGTENTLAESTSAIPDA